MGRSVILQLLSFELTGTVLRQSQRSGTLETQLHSHMDSSNIYCLDECQGAYSQHLFYTIFPLPIFTKRCRSTFSSQAVPNESLTF